jgi:hypothetical protein
MNQPLSPYQSYLLRLRWLDNAGEAVWRISIEIPGQDGKVYFDSLIALTEFLANKMAMDEPISLVEAEKFEERA